jgi:hypothetical protein
MQGRKTMEGNDVVEQVVDGKNMKMKEMRFCERISCMNHYKLFLSWTDNMGYGLSIKPTNVRLQENELPIGMFINCLFCSHRKPVDMFIKQMPIKEESRLIKPV